METSAACARSTSASYRLRTIYSIGSSFRHNPFAFKVSDQSFSCSHMSVLNMEIGILDGGISFGIVLFFPTARIRAPAPAALNAGTKLKCTYLTERHVLLMPDLPGSSLPPPPPAPSASFAPSLHDPSPQRDTSRQPEHRITSPRMYGGKCSTSRTLSPLTFRLLILATTSFSTLFLLSPRPFADPF